MRVLYLAHDLGDTAIWRRVDMLRKGGAEVVVAGFQRQQGSVPGNALTLGYTQDGKLLARVGQVAKVLPVIRKRLKRALGDKKIDIVLARNLEMLLLARAARPKTVPATPIVYELLDVHRVMLRDDAPGQFIRGIERWLLKSAAQIWISSPGFQEHYLTPYMPDAPETVLVENKPLATGSDASTSARMTPVSPGRITIGWFGILRCPWSLKSLDTLTRAAPGRYRVVLSGRPARDVLPDFDAVVAANPDLDFQGPYSWPDGLPKIYGQCDLAWLIDRFDPGQNSDWLLPNRLYEGGLYGAVPVVLNGAQSAARTASLGCGLHVVRPDLDAVTDVLAPLDDAAIAKARRQIAALPATTWKATQADCDRLIGALQHAIAGRSTPATSAALVQGVEP